MILNLKLKWSMKNKIIYRGILRVAFTGFVVALLPSCFVAKTYVRPDNVVETEKFRTDKLPQDSLSMANISWKELFTDPVLQEYIDKGLTNNMDIRMALQTIAIAEAYAKQGKAGYAPSLNLNSSAAHQEFSSNSAAGLNASAINQFELSGALSWEVDIWGKIRSNKRASAARYLQSVAAHQTVKSRLVANIASTYYQLLTVDEQIKVTEETIETRKKGLETTIALKDAGNVTEVGVKQTEAQLYGAQAILVDLKVQSRFLENTLSILLGDSPNTINRTTLEEQTIDIPFDLGVSSELLSNRPDVISAEYGLINAFEMTNVARSAFYPSLTLNASGGFQSFELDKLFNANSLFSSLMGGLTQPILNNRRVRTQFEVSKAQQEQALLQFKYALLVAGKEVSDAMYGIETASKKIEIKERENEALNLATDYSQELLDNGLANYLEVLVAQERALTSNLDMVAAKNSRLQAIVDLYEALGGGWR